MTVKELIEALQEQDPDAKVVMMDDRGWEWVELLDIDSSEWDQTVRLNPTF